MLKLLSSLNLDHGSFWNIQLSDLGTVLPFSSCKPAALSQWCKSPCCASYPFLVSLLRHVSWFPVFTIKSWEDANIPRIIISQVNNYSWWHYVELMCPSLLLITKIYMTYNSYFMCTWQPSHHPLVFPIFCDKRGLVFGATMQVKLKPWVAYSIIA